MAAPSFLLSHLFVLLLLPGVVFPSCFAPSEPLPPPVLDPNSPDLITFFDKLNTRIRDPLASADPPWNTTVSSFALEVTSANATLWNTYRTAPVLGDYPDGQPANVTGDTAFRIASISKVFTVLAILIQQQEGNLSLKDPVTKYLPELLENDIESGVRWDHISLESLASQLSGVPREYGQEDLGDLIVAELFGIYDRQDAGFPPLGADDYPTCGTNHETSKTCSKKDIIKGSRKRPPVFAPNYQSTYSNIAFILLGFVLESVTDKSYQDALSSSILGPLGMQHTTVERPKDSMGVIPALYNDWAYVAGAYDPTGGLYSTSSDLSIFLRAVLGSVLLDEATTNAWFKPHSWSSSLNAAFGMPWEIYRTTELLSDTDRGITIVTKAGNLYGYSSRVILLPEYNLGITALVAGYPQALKWLENEVLAATATFVEETARRQARERYAGFYKSSKINSSVTLEVDGGSGLVVQSWISNGTDFLAEYAALQTGHREPELGRAQLVRAGLHRSNGGEVWRVTFVPKIREKKSVIDVCMINDVDSLSYGTRSLQEFLFLADESEKVDRLELPALRVVLQKQPIKDSQNWIARQGGSALVQNYLETWSSSQPED